MIDSLAERLGISRWVVWVGLAALLVAIIILYRRWRSGASGAAGVGPNSAGAILNGPWSKGADGMSANPLPTAPDGGADQGNTPAPGATVPTIPPIGQVRPRRVTTVTLPSDMTWPQIAQAYAGSSSNAQWVYSWNAQLHSQPWWTVAKGTKVNIPQAA